MTAARQYAAGIEPYSSGAYVNARTAMDLDTIAAMTTADHQRGFAAAIAAVPGGTAPHQTMEQVQRDLRPAGLRPHLLGGQSCV